MAPLARTAFGPEISTAAATYHLDPRLVEAMVIVESGGKTSAYRYEPGYWRLYCAKHPRYKEQNPLRVAASYGLLQVMAPTAHSVGFPLSDPPEKLFIPEVGLDYGCKYLASLIQKFNGDIDAAISAYNAGPGNAKRDASGKFPNDAYVQKVKKHWRQG